MEIAGGAILESTTHVEAKLPNSRFAQGFFRIKTLFSCHFSIDEGRALPVATGR